MTGREMLNELANSGAKRGLIEDCKTSIPGSNPGGASNFLEHFRTSSLCLLAKVGEARPKMRPDSLDTLYIGGRSEGESENPCETRKAYSCA